MKAVPAPVVVPLLAGAVLLGSAVGPGVSAAFTSSPSVTSGALTAATVSGSYATGTDDLGGAGGTGGASYEMTVSGLLITTSTHRYTTFTNTSSVPVTFASTLTATAASGTMTVAVDRCSVAWASLSCSGTTTSLLAAIALPATLTFPSLAASGPLYVRYRFTATSATAGATVTASGAWSGVARDRTAG